MTGRPEILALIPARGGSKSIPRKNLLPIAAKPLLAYSIEQARASRHITRTVVSTDDAEIADVARACGADVPFERPSELAQDRSTDLDVFRHAGSELDFDCAVSDVTPATVLIAALIDRLHDPQQLWIPETFNFCTLPSGISIALYFTVWLSSLP